MLFTQILKENTIQVSADELALDIEESCYEFGLESALTSLEINSVKYDAEHLAIEAYNDYNGNMTVIESQLTALTEEANEGILAKIKGWVKKAWEFLKKLYNKAKDWVLGLFNKYKRFIEKYKDDTREITGEFYSNDVTKAVRDLVDICKKLVDYYNDVVHTAFSQGKLPDEVPNNKAQMKEFLTKKFNFNESMMDPASDRGYVFEYISGKEKKSRTITLKDFCKELQADIDSKKITKEIENIHAITVILLKACEKVSKGGSAAENYYALVSTIYGTIYNTLGSVVKSVNKYCSENMAEANRGIEKLGKSDK